MLQIDDQLPHLSAEQLLRLEQPQMSLPGFNQQVPDTIPRNLKMTIKATKREYRDCRRCRNAIEQIITLPKPGESLHFIVDGLYEPVNLIPAVRFLSKPALIKKLTITTLGLNRDNVELIAYGMDQGKILDCSIITSHAFKELDWDEYAYLKAEIQDKRGGRVNGVRSHCKLMLLEMSDGNWYTIEGSGNMRSCQSIEQFVMTNDEGLLKFHRGWLESYLESRGDGKDDTIKKQANPKKSKAMA